MLIGRVALQRTGYINAVDLFSLLGCDGCCLSRCVLGAH